MDERKGQEHKVFKRQVIRCAWRWLGGQARGCTGIGTFEGMGREVTEECLRRICFDLHCF